MYKSNMQSTIDVKEGQEQTWNPCIRALEGHVFACNSIAFSPDGGRLASGSDDQTVRPWSVQTGAVLQVMMGHNDAVQSVAYSPDGMLVASGSDDRTIRIWDVESGLQIGIYTGHPSWILRVAFSADGQRIASGDKDNAVHVWSTDSPHTSGKVFKADGLWCRWHSLAEIG